MRTIFSILVLCLLLSSSATSHAHAHDNKHLELECSLCLIVHGGELGLLPELNLLIVSIINIELDQKVYPSDKAQLGFLDLNTNSPRGPPVL